MKERPKSSYSKESKQVKQSPLKEVSIARALYSNVAEYPEELCFEAGQLLRVLSEESDVGSGWWLCADSKGRKGVVPANRLQVMQRFDDEGQPVNPEQNEGDKGDLFFQVANPLFEDFFMFNHRASPFEAPPFDRQFFNGAERRLFPFGFRDRFEPVRRINSCDDALNMSGAQVRHIPIKVIDGKKDSNLAPTPEHPESQDGFTPLPDFGGKRIDRRFSDFPQTPMSVRRTMSSGRVSPIGGDSAEPFFPYSANQIGATTSNHAPIPPTRRQNGFPQKIPVEVIPSSSSSTTSFPTAPFGTSSSSDEDDRRSIRSQMTTMSDRTPLRSLIIPSSVPGRSLEIPLGPSPNRGSSLSLNHASNGSRPPFEAKRQQTPFEPPRDSQQIPLNQNQGPQEPSQMEKLTQRLRKMAGKPFRTLPPMSSEERINDAYAPNPNLDSPLQQQQQQNLRPLAQNQSNLPNTPNNSNHADKLDNSLLAALGEVNNSTNSTENGRTPSPSSSGIVADINEPSSEEKRVSDTSSLSDQNSSLSENSEEQKNQLNQQQSQQPITTRHVPITVHGRLNGNSKADNLGGGSSKLGFSARQNSGSTNSLLQDFFDKIERPELKKFGPTIKNQSNGRGEWLIPSSIEEDMRRNNSPQWNNIPITTSARNSNVGAILDEEVAARKRVICNKMSESLKAIGAASEQLNKITAPQQWRVAHILQGNLNGLRDSVATINEALDEFVDATQRISIDRTNPKYVELSKLMAPLHDSKSMIGSLRKNLDLGGWTVAVLSKDNRNSAEIQTAHLRHTADPLEQFVNYAKTVPNDCRRVHNWAQALAPTSTILFLSPSATTKPLFQTPTVATQARDTLERTNDTHKPANKIPPIHLLDTPIMDDGKRLSGSSTSSADASSSSQPSSILVNSKSRSSEKPRGKVTFADESGDRTSSGSSIDNSSVEYASIRKLPTSANGHNGNSNGQPPVASAVLRNLRNGHSNGGGSMLNHPPESRIIEEDDLESNVSDRESLFQDYAYLDDVVPGRVAPSANPRQPNGHAPRLNGNGHSSSVDDENDDDRQLVRFYAPQLEQHTEALTLAVDEFLVTVENNLPPREFVQKGKLIILAAHKLIYIGDSVSQCVQNRQRSTRLRKAADKLCTELQDCVQATKAAADEYPDIKSMQAMVDSVMGVSRSAHELKLLVRDCC